MREILFRGKCVGTKEWIYGYFFAKPILEKYFIELGNEMWQVDPATVGEYTGLQDKNGKKIFEGDIVKFYPQMWCPADNKKLIGVIRYGLAHITASDPHEWAEYYGFHVSCKCGSIDEESTDEKSCFEEPITPNVEFEIIGNIQDNPELLEVK